MICTCGSGRMIGVFIFFISHRISLKIKGRTQVHINIGSIRESCYHVFSMFLETLDVCFFFTSFWWGICFSCWGSVLHILFIDVVFYSLIKSQELKESVPSDLRQQAFLLVRPMHQVSACLPYLIWLPEPVGACHIFCWLACTLNVSPLLSIPMPLNQTNQLII